MKLKKDISRTIARHLMFSASGKEKELLAQWKLRSDKNANGYQIIKQFWHLKPVSSDIGEDSVPTDLFLNRVRLLGVVADRQIWWKIAASVAFLIAMSSILFQFLIFPNDGRVELIAASGQRTEAVLPDGSRVWLNSCSRLVYEARFGRIRYVELTGEAFFDVSKHKTRPFHVKADGLFVKVTGTQFNVRNYSSDPTIETTLIEGCVSLSIDDERSLKMKPGETIIFDKQSGKLVRRNVNSKDNILWKEGILVFNSTPFSDMIPRLERWYNIKVIYDSAEFKEIHYTGTIRNLRLDQVFEFISLTNPIQVEMEKNDIRISGKQVKPKK